MKGLTAQFVLSLRLYFRNTMALLYGYLFPTIFLVAFWTLYRYDQVPLVRHVGEFLTITVLGGTCFGLPTTMVGERERGVWRRYRLTPVPTSSLVVSTILARYVLLLSAGLLQLILAAALGMTWPRHPLDLWIAFTFASFAFLGLGLVIATLADNVPAVQALGQTLFLPMLIIGGVAVPLTSLPPWAAHVSAFLPGRYAVEAIQGAMTGAGLSATGFNLLALAAIGIASCIAGGKLFRWDRDQRFAALHGKPWLAVALLAWVGVGIAAEARGRGRVAATTNASVLSPPTAAVSTVPPAVPAPNTTPPAGPSAPPVAPAHSPGSAAPAPPPAPRRAVGSPPAPAPASSRPAAQSAEPAASAASTPATPTPSGSSGGTAVPPSVTTWQQVTLADIDRDLTFDRLPADRSVVTPIATPDMQPESDVADEVGALEDTLLDWSPGLVQDPVQRARNLLEVLGVHDVAQTPLEAYLPRVVFRRLLDASPREELIKVLYWIALHPEGGTMLSPQEIEPLRLRGVPGDEEEIRNRAAIYAVKLLGRLTGHIR